MRVANPQETRKKRVPLVSIAMNEVCFVCVWTLKSRMNLAWIPERHRFVHRRLPTGVVSIEEDFGMVDS